MVKKEDINKILDILEETYPQAECALDHQNVYQLIVAVALSAQTTDKSVNQVTPALFEKYPTPYELAVADPEEVAQYIKRIGMYKTKSKTSWALPSRWWKTSAARFPTIMAPSSHCREWAERQPMLSSLWASGIRG